MILELEELHSQRGIGFLARAILCGAWWIGHHSHSHGITLNSRMSWHLISTESLRSASGSCQIEIHHSRINDMISLWFNCSGLGNFLKLFAISFLKLYNFMSSCFGSCISNCYRSDSSISNCYRRDSGVSRTILEHCQWQCSSSDLLDTVQQSLTMVSLVICQD